MKRIKLVFSIILLISICIFVAACNGQDYEKSYDLPDNYQIMSMLEMPNNKIIVGCIDSSGEKRQWKLLLFSNNLKLLREYQLSETYDRIDLEGFRLKHNQIGIITDTMLKVKHSKTSSNNRIDSLIFDLNTGKIVRKIPNSALMIQPNGVSSCFSPNSKYALISKRKVGLCVYDIDNNKIIGSYNKYSELMAGWCKWNDNASINLIDASTLKRVSWFPNKQTITENTGLDKYKNIEIRYISPDGKTFAYPDYSKGFPIIKVVNISDGTISKEYEYPDCKKYNSACFKWSNDGKYMLIYLIRIGSNDIQLRIISLSSFKEVTNFSRNGMELCSVANAKGNSAFVCVNDTQTDYKATIYKLRLK